MLAEDNYINALLAITLLQYAGYDDVCICANGEIAWEHFCQQKFDICLVDLTMPLLNGWELVKKIRTIDEFIPIIILTGSADYHTKVECLKIGASSLIAKPLSFEELDLKIKIFLKLTQNAQPAPSYFAIGQYILNIEKQILTLYDVNIELSPKQFKILHLLVRQKGQVVKKEDIMQEVWGAADNSIVKSLEVFISQIRKKMKDDSSIIIESIRNMGYKLQVFDGIN